MTLNQKTHWIVRATTVALAFAVATVVGQAGVGAKGAPGRDDACTLVCLSGVCPLSGFHAAYTANQGDSPNGGSSTNGPHDECFNFTCNETHPCSPGALSPDQVDREVASGNVAALSRLIAGNSDVSVNLARRAIQVSGCAGDIIVNLPVPGSTLARLVANHP